MFNLLLPEGYPKNIGIGEALINALIGFAVVFLGISILVGVIYLVGFIMKGTKSKKQKKTEVKVQEPVSVVPASDETDEETVAVIMATIMAYYEKENRKCDFVVKRIKKI